jgi:hypothetical protein
MSGPTQFKILLVEHKSNWKGSNGIFREWIERALGDIRVDNSPCYILTQIETYEEASKALSQDDPDCHLLITDISLGKLKDSRDKAYTGTKLLKEAMNRNIPAIPVSGLDMKEDPIEGLIRNDLSNKSEFIDKIKAIWREWYAYQLDQDVNEPPFISHTTTKTIPIPPMFKALLIGIAEYSQVRKLTKTTNDVYGLRQALVNNGYLYGYIDCLVNQQATKQEILKRLDTLAASGENDTVMVFFSGHGMSYLSKDYLCPVDADLNNIKETCISSDEFTTALRKIQAGRLVVFLDSCHSGGVGQARDANLNLQEGLSQQTYDQIAQSENGKGRVIIASCLPNEVSWELTDWKNGLFTHYLLEGLNGAAADSDGKVRIMGLSGYISRNVPNHGQEQHPFIQLAAQDFVVAINPNSQSPVTEETLREEIAPTQTVVQETASTIKNQNPTRQQKNELCQKILDAYDEDTFEGLCNNMGVVYSDLHGARNFENKIFKLITKCIIEGLYEDLVVTVCNRPYFTRQNT